MNSEKVKEIKKALKCCIKLNNTRCGDRERQLACISCPYANKGECDVIISKNCLTLINELESENERLKKSDTSKEESSIEYYNLYKDLKRKNKDLNELCELQRVSIAESFVRENQLKDRIAELEKGNEILRKHNIGYHIANNYEAQDQLKQFAERLKEKIENCSGCYIPDCFESPTNEFAYSAIEVSNAIDETLKEFIDERN
jgi:hypothetical protein